MNELTTEEAFKLFLDGYSLEYFTFSIWWDLSESTPVSVFKKCNQWRLKS